MILKLNRNTTLLGALAGGIGSGGGGFVYPNSADRPFATIAARDTWAAANLSDLVDATTVVLVDSTPQVWYLWTGDTDPTSYDANEWIDATPLIQGPAGPSGAGVELSGVGSYELFTPGPGPDFEPMAIGARRLLGGTGDFEFDSTIIVPQESIQIGFSGVLSALGAVPLFRSFVTGRRGTFPFTYYDKATGTGRTVEVDAGGNQRGDIQPDTDETITTPGSFTITTSAAEVVSALYIRTPTPQTVSGVRMRMTVQGQSEPFYYWPSRSLAEETAGQLDGSGRDLTTTGPNSEAMVDLINSPLFLLGVSDPNDPVTVTVEYAFDSGELAGSGGVPYAAADVNLVTLRELAYLSEVGEDNVQPNWDQTDNTADDFIRNKPTIPTARTDEDIRDVTAAQLVAGNGVTIVEDDAANTLTITATGATPQPGPGPDTLYYGLSSSNNPAAVNLAALTQVDPTDPQTVSTGVASQGDYFIILTPNTHDITSITDTVLQQPVTDIFTKTDDVRTEGAVTFDSYVIGPLNAGLDEEYVLEF